jgi:putative transposase
MRPHHLSPLRPDQTYFVTSSTRQKLPLFQVEATAELFIDQLLQYRDAGKFLVHEFVVMPDHFHLLFTPLGDVTLEKGVQLIKGGFAHRLNQVAPRRSSFWSAGFTDRRVRNVEELAGIKKYIRENPVAAHLAERAEEYRFSSASGRFRLDPYPAYLSG